MSENEMETVTIQVPKRFMQVLKALNYFGSTKTEFFRNAVKSWISCELGETNYREIEKIRKKYPWLEDAAVTY